jgi:sugar phosphate isomerase/epimerase
MTSRRDFLQQAGLAIGAAWLSPWSEREKKLKRKIPVSAHLWVYASTHPPEYDCTPDLETVFSDLSYAGYDGVEIMDILLRHDDAVQKLSELVNKYGLPVTGSSYSMALWNRDTHSAVLKDVQTVVPRLGQLNAKTLGVSVGDAGHAKTEAELDAQAEILRKMISIANDNGVGLNLHNHVYEVENGLHDLKGTLARIPDIKLGPDLGWLVRAGVDPVSFIREYGHQIAYMHIRDQYADNTWTEYVGQGTIDYKSIGDAFRVLNYNGRAAVELAWPRNKPSFHPEHPLKDDWKWSLAYVRKTFQW